MAIEELKKFIGRTDEPYIVELEKGAIKRYAEAIDDQNPVYHDEEYAAESRYGTIISPPGFFGWPVKSRPHLSGVRKELLEAIMMAGYKRLLDGGSEFDFLLPVRTGDILAASGRIADVYEREGKAGKLMFAVTETTYINQNGDRVANVRSTLVCS
ncbi:MAG: MaoC family dehydratase N-terminal domain-containing protein [Syntrophales bacterium]|nr:MaoC family dehydratase N-terminal domain-containing protein [Syntrophales bacterium]